MEQYKIIRRAASEDETIGESRQEVLQNTKNKMGESRSGSDNKVRELYPQENGFKNTKANSQGSSNNLVHLLLFLILLSNIALFARQGSVSEGQNSALSELSENILQLKELSEKYLPELSKIQSSVNEIQEKFISFVDEKDTFSASSFGEQRNLNSKRKNLINESTPSKLSRSGSSKTPSSKISGNTNKQNVENPSFKQNNSSTPSKDSTNTFPEKDKQELKSSKFHDDKLNPPSIFDPQEENSSSESNLPPHNSSQSSSQPSLHKSHLNKNDTLRGTANFASAPIQCWQAKTKQCVLRK